MITVHPQDQKTALRSAGCCCLTSILPNSSRNSNRWPGRVWKPYHGSKCLNFRHSRSCHNKKRPTSRTPCFAWPIRVWRVVVKGGQKWPPKNIFSMPRQMKCKGVKLNLYFWEEFWKGCQLALYLLQDVLVDKNNITTVPFRLTLKSFLFLQVPHCMVVNFAATMLGCHKDSAPKSHW